LFVATETTQVLGTLAVVYGWFVEPIGWRYALLVWAYALAWLPIENLAKVLVNRMLLSGPSWHERHLARVHGILHNSECAPGTAGRRARRRAAREAA
jgi:H+-transporting ATPase